MQNINWQLATAQKVQFLRQSASYNEKRPNSGCAAPISFLSNFPPRQSFRGIGLVRAGYNDS